jgi:hypothetical protein
LKSENVIINAPMSFAGAAQRAWRLRGQPIKRQVITTPFVVVLLVLWVCAIACWYLVFGLFLVPYRLLRRGARKRKAGALRHRELLSTIEAKEQARETPKAPTATVL